MEVGTTILGSKLLWFVNEHDLLTRTILKDTLKSYVATHLGNTTAYNEKSYVATHIINTTAYNLKRFIATHIVNTTAMFQQTLLALRLTI